VTRLPASAAEPRHTRGGAGGAGRGQDEPPWYRQKVKVAKRVWGEGRYSPGAVAWHAQITALHGRPERCRASVARLAEWMGDAKRTGERYLRELSAPGADGIPELTTIRHTDSGGDGETAERYTRPLGRHEHFALVPVLAAKTLRHRLFVLYCALAYADATSAPVTAAELAALLGVTEMTARRMTTELEHLGWITVHHRTGPHGRNEYEVHDHPLHPVPDTPEEPPSNGGSGASTDGGSLAIKEDAGLTDERNAAGRGSFRRRRDTRNKAATPVDNSLQTLPASAAPATFRPPTGTPVRHQDGRSYDGPELGLSPRVWAVLEPVRDLLPGVRTFVMRRIAREVGHQLDNGIFAEDIRDQLTRMRAWTPSEDIRDAGRWILGAALPARPGKCGGADCHYGFQRYTGAPCKACADLEAGRPRAAHPPHTSPWHECADCRAPSPTPLPRGLCATCTPAQPTGT
jgi:hypothetical protein